MFDFFALFLHLSCYVVAVLLFVEACIAIGFAVFLAHCVLIPITGCSINPTRTIGLLGSSGSKRWYSQMGY